MKLLPVVLFLPAVCAASSLLTQTARDVLAQPGGREKAEVFLKQATIENAEDPEPLTLLAALKSVDLENDPDGLRAQVQPMLAHLLELREHNTATKPAELALALELSARLFDMLKEEAQANAFRARSGPIRKEQVHQMFGLGMAQAAPSSRYVFGSGNTHPTVLVKSDPQYSEDARRSKVSGTVLVSLVVDAEGLPKQIELVRGLGFGLDESAAQTVAKWRFRPGSKDGQPVPVQASIEVNFRLL